MDDAKERGETLRRRPWLGRGQYAILFFAHALKPRLFRLYRRDRTLESGDGTTCPERHRHETAPEPRAVYG